MEAAGLGMVDGLPDAAFEEVGVFEQVLRGLEGAAGEVVLLGEGDDLALRAFGEPDAVGVLDLLGEGGRHEGHGGVDVGMLEQVFAVDEVEEGVEPGPRAHDVHVAIGAGAHPGGDAQSGGAAPAADAGVGGGEEGRAAAIAGAGLALGKGDVDPVAPAARLDAQNPHEHGGEGGDDAGVVAGEVAGVLERPEAGVAGHVHGTAEPLGGDLGAAVAAVGDRSGRRG